ncbi:MAG: polyprenyl synthetase family protein [Oscillospiraceae bacterium]
MENQYTTKEYVNLIEEELKKCVPLNDEGQSVVAEAMRYSINGGGKRIRPILTLEFCKACGGDLKNGLAFAVSIEMIHTYSLIHDDLPCMDNDDMRRGRPSCHKAYGEEYALLAGDGLLTLAFKTLASNELVSPKYLLKAVNFLSDYSGINGMIGGQVLDLLSEETTPTLQTLETIDKLKTSALIKAASILGCLAAENDDEIILNAALEYSKNIGLAFQIVDDILDVTSSEEELGKPIGSDQKNEKITYVKLLGIEKSKEIVDDLTAKAILALDVFPNNTDFLKELAYELANRNK